MRCVILFLFLTFLTSCFRFNGRISIQNDRTSNLRIETSPIIHSGSGGWENGIHYYNKDSITWKYTLGNNINAKIIQPNTWKRKDSSLVLNRSSGYHYFDYSQFRFDSTVFGIYEMYPNSSFTIGKFTTHKKIIPSKDKLYGRFSIGKLIVNVNNDTLIANNDQEIWDMLLRLDKNKHNLDKEGHKKKIRDWVVSIK